MIDPILHWNAVALEANRHSHSSLVPADQTQLGPTMSSRALAIVHLAMHDAFFAAKGQPNESWLNALPVGNPGTNAEAAVAAAACTALAALYPSRRLVFEAAAQDAQIPVLDAERSGRFGREVAEAVIKALAIKVDEPGASDLGYVASFAPGCHRADPDNHDQGYHAPFYGETVPPVVTAGPHPLDSPAGWLAPEDPGYVKDLGAAEYVAALREVHAKGGAPDRASTTRKGEETVIGLYWAYDGARGLGTPPRLYNLIAREISRARSFSIEKNARLFARMNAAMADAGKYAWLEKYRHDLWRPVLGVREHLASMGPVADGGRGNHALCDSLWLPLGAPRTNVVGGKPFTPPFPAYPSGHATFGAAAFQVIRCLEGFADQTVDDIAFDIVSEELDGRSLDSRGAVRTRHKRHFDSLWQAIFENGVSRVYLGVHWVFDAFAASDVQDEHGHYKAAHEIQYTRNVGGVPLGLAIADDVCGNFKQPAMEGEARDMAPARNRLNLESTPIQ